MLLSCFSNPVKETFMVNESVMFFTWEIVAPEAIINSLINSTLQDRARVSYLCFKSL